MCSRERNFIGWFCAVLIIASMPAAAAPPVSRSAGAAAPAGSQPAGGGRKVSFVTEDNLTIAGFYTPAAPGAGEKAAVAILLHMYNSNHAAFDPLVPYLHAAGFAVLAIDLRGHGESVGPPQLGLTQRVANRDAKLFAQMDADVEAAYCWLAEQPDVDLARFVLVGASVGCSVALHYAAQDRSVDGIVCMTPGTSYLGIDSIADVQKYGNRPLLLTAAEAERRACDELSKLAPSATVKIYPGGEGEGLLLHGTRMFVRVPGVEKLIVEFLLKAAGPPSREVVVASSRGKVYYAPESGNAAHLDKRNRRWFSSAEEAERRGLRAPSAGRGGAKRAGAGGGLPAEAFPEKP